MADAFAKDFEAQSLRTLYTKMKKTAKARFNCAKRLSSHQTYSLWSLSLFSTGLIGMTLISALNIRTNLSPPFYNLLQIMLALLVLVLSLLLSANNYSDRSEKMHRCALELNALCHEILPDCQTDREKPDVYKQTLDKYGNILNSYENHSNIDFDLVRIALSDDYPLRWYQRALIRVRYVFGFWLYLSLLILLVTAFVVLLWPRHKALEGNEAKPPISDSR
jgi:hypothetical protein